MSVDLSIDTMNTIQMTIEDDNEIGMTAGDSQIVEAVSPKVELEAVTGGTKMTVTDVDGEHVATIMDGVDGEDGESAYVHIKWSTNQPTQDSDMKDVPDNYIGIYSGDAATAPTTYTSYTWYKYKGETGAAGQDGADGTSAYAYVRYSATEPTQDSDMKTTPDAWMGIYSGDSATAPTTYTSYTWYKIKGETGATGQTGPTGPGVPNGGTTGQVLVKTSNADQATAWADAIERYYLGDISSVSAFETAVKNKLSSMSNGEICNVQTWITTDITNIKSGTWTGRLTRIIDKYGTLILNSQNGGLLTIGINDNVFTYDAISDQITQVGIWTLKKSFTQSDFESVFNSSNSSGSLYVNESIHMAYIDLWAYNVLQLSANTSYLIFGSDKIPTAYKPGMFNAVTSVFTESSTGTYVHGYGYYTNSSNNLGLNMSGAVPANKYNRLTFLYTY